MDNRQRALNYLGLARRGNNLVYGEETVGAAIGCNACAICLLTDVALAKAFVEALDEPAHYAQLLADLEVRVERVKKRRLEEKAHEKNLRHGGKKRK